MQLIYMDEIIRRIKACSPQWGSDGTLVYFNVENGEFYNEEDKNNFISNDLFSSFDFILLPHAPLIKIKKNYLGIRRFKHWDNEKFEVYFHGNVEEQPILNISWHKYLNDYIINIATEWCLENGIPYTTKSKPHEL